MATPRAQHGNFVSLQSLSDLFQAFNDTLGKEGTHTLMLRAGRARGIELAKMAKLSGPPTPENLALINGVLDQERLGRIEGASLEGEAMIVKYAESFESAVEMGSENPGSGYTAGIISGIAEHAMGQMFSIEQIGSVEKDGVDIFKAVAL